MAQSKAMDPTRAAARSKCNRFLSGHYPQRSLPQRMFAYLAEAVDADATPDAFATGPVVAAFEARVAGMFGKDAGVFFPTSAMAHHVALRLWAERRMTRNVGVHARSGLENTGGRAFAQLHNLTPVVLGEAGRPLYASDVQGLSFPMAAVLVDLPHAALGGRLIPWDELGGIARWARNTNVALHLDGDRIWSVKPAYNREYSEIGRYFDSLVVSFHQELGGLGGAILAGPADLIEEARFWRGQAGGDVPHAYPWVLAAKAVLDERLDRMSKYIAKAQELAAALSQVDGVACAPNPPETNLFQVHLKGDLEALWEATAEVSVDAGIWICDTLRPSPVPGYTVFDVSTGDASLAIKGGDATALVETVMSLSAAG